MSHARRRLSTPRALAASFAAVALVATLAPQALADEPAPYNGGEGSAAESVQVRVPLYTTPSPNDFGQSGVVRIQVGRSAPMRVLLDTGSTGLRLFPGALDRFRTGAQVTNREISTPSEGGAMRGVIAKAPITIGGVTTTRSVEFQVTKNTSSYVQGWIAKGVYGILGTGTGTTPLPNPLVALPGETGLRWSIHFGGEPAKKVPGGGSLILGASVPTDAVATLDMPLQGTNGFGALLWDDQSASGCWTIANRRTTCIPTQLDSLSDQLTLVGPSFAGLPTNDDGVVKSGIPIRMSDEGSVFDFWQVTTGTIPSFNLTKAQAKGPRLVNTGNRIYYDFTVTYDVTNGTISLAKPRG